MGRAGVNLAEAISEELERRQKRNQKYSLRSFARDLDVDPAMLSRVINNKSGLSPKNISLLVAKLGLTPSSEFYLSPEESYSTLTDDIVNSTSNWYDKAILSLADIKKNEASPEWIAQRLGIPVAAADEALKRLLRLELIEIRGRRLKGKRHHTQTSTNIPSEAIRRYHTQNLHLAIQALECVSVDLRDITSIVFPLDPDDLEEAKKLIKRFRRQFCKRFENTKASEIYSLAIQLFPLTQANWRRK